MGYLKKIALENFRVFDKITEFELNKITILTGANSSGKSSLYKCLLLLANNISRNSIYKIDFTGLEHNLGSYSDSVNKTTKNKHIRIVQTFYEPFTNPRKFPVQRGRNRTTDYFIHNDPESSNDALVLDLTYHESNNYGILTNLMISFKQGEKSILLFNGVISRSNKVKSHKVTLNIPFLIELINKLGGNFVMYRGKKITLDIEKLGNSNDYIELDISPSSVLYPESNKNDSRKDDIGYLIHQLTFHEDKIYEHINKFKRNKINHQTESNFKNQSIGMLIQSIVDSSYAYYNTLGYIEAVRAKSKRLYTIDIQANLFDSLLLDLNFVKLNKIETEFINKWFKEFGLADEIIFEKVAGGIATQVMFLKDNIKYSIADLGFGVTQLLPILLSIVLRNTYSPSKTMYMNGIRMSQLPKTFILEEPETNLHPKLQSRIADLIIDACDLFNINFIIETHSEYFIRRLQILTADKKLNNEDVSIYYFYDKKEKPENKKQVEKINILQNGSLDNDFGPGFFDESINMKFQLLKKKMKND